MARKKRESASGGGGDWLNTYADMVTLLLTFFVLLYSMSTLDATKFNLIVSALRSDAPLDDRIVIVGTLEGDDGGNTEGLLNLSDEVDMESVYLQLQAAIEAAGREESIQLDKGDGYIFVRFMDDMLFEPDSPRLKPADLEILNFVGYGIKSIQSDVSMISINGHTAAIPEDPNYRISDRELSTDRANAVLMHFEDQIGIDGDKLLAIGWGKRQPISSNDTEEGRSQNRRVEILINSDNVLGDQLTSVYEKLVNE